MNKDLENTDGIVGLYVERAEIHIKSADDQFLIEKTVIDGEDEITFVTAQGPIHFFGNGNLVENLRKILETVSKERKRIALDVEYWFELLGREKEDAFEVSIEGKVEQAEVEEAEVFERDRKKDPKDFLIEVGFPELNVSEATFEGVNVTLSIMRSSLEDIITTLEIVKREKESLKG